LFATGKKKRKIVFSSRLKKQKLLDYSNKRRKSVYNIICLKQQKLLCCNSNKRKIVFASRLKMQNLLGLRYP